MTKRFFSLTIAAGLSIALAFSFSAAQTFAQQPGAARPQAARERCRRARLPPQWPVSVLTSKKPAMELVFAWALDIGGSQLTADDVDLQTCARHDRWN